MIHGSASNKSAVDRDVKHKDIYLKTLGQLTAFIRANGTYALPSDRPEVHGEIPHRGAVLATLDNIVPSQDRIGEDYWDIKATALSMFLFKAPELRDVFAPVAWYGANLSRCSVLDPLTFQGLSESLFFINNTLFDDDWRAIYTKDGERRVVSETIDDLIQGGRSTAGVRHRDRLDKDDAWMAAAKRTVLSYRNFYSVFGDDVAGIINSPPTQEQLLDLWMNRRYSDFAPHAPRM